MTCSLLSPAVPFRSLVGSDKQSDRGRDAERRERDRDWDRDRELERERERERERRNRSERERERERQREEAERRDERRGSVREDRRGSVPERGHARREEAEPDARADEPAIPTLGSREAGERLERVERVERDLLRETQHAPRTVLASSTGTSLGGSGGSSGFQSGGSGSPSRVIDLRASTFAESTSTQDAVAQPAFTTAQVNKRSFKRFCFF